MADSNRNLEALKNNYILNHDVYFICNVAHLKHRIKRSRKYKGMDKRLDDYLKIGRIGDLRDEVVNPLLEIIYKNLKYRYQTSPTNFPSLALQSLRFLVNITHFSSDEDGNPPSISEKFRKLK